LPFHAVAFAVFEQQARLKGTLGIAGFDHLPITLGVSGSALHRPVLIDRREPRHRGVVISASRVLKSKPAAGDGRARRGVSCVFRDTGDV
jgi:hypothetical protein